MWSVPPQFTTLSFTTNQVNLSYNEDHIEEIVSNTTVSSTLSNKSTKNVLNSTESYFLEKYDGTSFTYYFVYGDIIISFFQSKILFESRSDSFWMKFNQSNIVEPIGESKLPSQSNFLFGRHSIILNHYTHLEYPNLYDGIDLVFFIDHNSLKYEFHVSPYQDPSIIQINYDQIDVLTVNQSSTIIKSGKLMITDQNLKSYSSYDKMQISSSFKKSTGRSTSLSFDIGSYDRSQSLIIDPVIVPLSGYIGGNQTENAVTFKSDNLGNYYILTNTMSSNFPIMNALYPTHNNNNFTDITVSKFTETGSLVFSTFIGGAQTDTAYDMVIDHNYNILITGCTNSTDFPTKNPLNASAGNGKLDLFVVKINADGNSLNFSTLITGTNDDIGSSIGLNLANEIIIFGSTTSTDFPVIAAINSTSNGFSDLILLKLSGDGSTILVSSYIGGSLYEFPRDLVIRNNAIILSGITISSDFPVTNGLQTSNPGSFSGFLMNISSDLTSVIYSTYFGGTTVEEVGRMAIDSASNIIIAGWTLSSDYPVINAQNFGLITGSAETLYISKFNSSGNMIQSFMVGGSSKEEIFDMKLDEFDNLYLAGYTNSTNFPTKSAFDKLGDQKDYYSDGFIMKFNLTKYSNNLIYSTYFGGSLHDQIKSLQIASDGIVVFGDTQSSDFPISDTFYNNIQNGSIDTFIAKLYEINEVTLNGISNGSLLGPNDQIELNISEITNFVIQEYRWNNSAKMNITENLIPIPITDGYYSLNLYFKDKFGREYNSTYQLILDRNPPSVNIKELGERSSFKSNVELHVSVEDENNITSLLFNWDGISNNSIGSEMTIFTPGTEGAHILNFYSRDELNNSKKVEFAILVDNTTPNVNISGISNNTLFQLNNSVDIEITDNYQIENYVVDINNNVLYNKTTTNNTVFVSFTLDSSMLVNNNKLVIIATDVAGNSVQVKMLFEYDGSNANSISSGQPNNSTNNTNGDKSPNQNIIIGVVVGVVSVAGGSTFYIRKRKKQLQGQNIKEETPEVDVETPENVGNTENSTED